MSKNKTLKKVIAFSSALVISSSLLTGCGADPPQEQYRDSDKEDITIVNHDSGSFSDFLAGIIVGTVGPIIIETTMKAMVAIIVEVTVEIVI